MASINSLSGSSSTSSIYGNANVISGLASGMDTEAMIENAVSGIQKKIASLQQDRTMMEWEQEAYRSIIDKMVNFANKYTSFSSSTNLLSESFFRNSISVSTNGVNKDLISASGKPTSNVQILGVGQLATAATYKISGSKFMNSAAGTISGLKGFDLDTTTKVGSLNGSFTLKFGNTSATIRFDESDVYENTGELIEGIKKKLENTDLDGKVSVAADGTGSFKFVIDDKELKNGNNLVTLSAVSGNLESKLGLTADSKTNVHDVGNTISGGLTDTPTYRDLLKDQMISFTLNGVTKNIKFTEKEVEKLVADQNDDNVERSANEKLQELLQTKLNGAFGQGAITVDLDKNKNQLSFSVKTDSASALKINGGKAIGLAGDEETSYLNTGAKLGSLITFKDNANLTVFNNSEDPNDSRNGKYEFKIGETVIGYFNEESTLDDVMQAINNNTESPVTVTFSKLSNQFTFTAKDTGEAVKIDFGTKGLAAELFGGSTQVDGTDAIFSMSIDGEVFNGIKRSTNSVEVDGMTMKLQGTFGDFDENNKMDLYKTDDEGKKVVDQAKLSALQQSTAVSFTSATDSDKIVAAIKDMVKDYNEMANEIKEAYSTMPLYNSSGKRYKPLTESDEKDMSESAVEKYNEKAKTGLLFGDNVLSGLYEEIRSAVNELGMTNIGITTAFENGKTTLVVDEAKLKETLNNDPEKVTEVFTKSRENGASADGFMTKLQNTMDTYTKTTGKKGILIDLVGSVKSPLSLLNNTYKSKLDSMDETIARWQDKLSDKIDYYNKQFTRLEKMISQMNSQSSSLMGLMGY